jgi:hypothetical protein
VIALEVADLVVIASRTLGLETEQVLDLLDPAAAEHALARARPGSEPSDPATDAAALLHALVRGRVLGSGNRQVARRSPPGRSTLPPWQAGWPRGCDSGAVPRPG